MGIFTTSVIAKASLELGLGICIKLLIDNGRIHPADFVNDFLYWLPGVHAQDGDGLSRQMGAQPTTPAPSRDIRPSGTLAGGHHG